MDGIAKISILDVTLMGLLLLSFRCRPEIVLEAIQKSHGLLKEALNVMTILSFLT